MHFSFPHLMLLRDLKEVGSTNSPILFSVFGKVEQKNHNWWKSKNRIENFIVPLYSPLEWKMRNGEGEARLKNKFYLEKRRKKRKKFVGLAEKFGFLGWHYFMLCLWESCHLLHKFSFAFFSVFLGKVLQIYWVVPSFFSCLFSFLSCSLVFYLPFLVFIFCFPFISILSDIFHITPPKFWILSRSLLSKG